MAFGMSYESYDALAIAAHTGPSVSLVRLRAANAASYLCHDMDSLLHPVVLL